MSAIAMFRQQLPSWLAYPDFGRKIQEVGMRWLTFDQSIAQGIKVCGNPPQYLEFPVDGNALTGEIPAEAHFEKEGIAPGPSFQWYAWIGERPLIIERVTPDSHDRVFVAKYRKRLTSHS